MLWCVRTLSRKIRHAPFHPTPSHTTHNKRRCRKNGANTNVLLTWQQTLKVRCKAAHSRELDQGCGYSLKIICSSHEECLVLRQVQVQKLPRSAPGRLEDLQTVRGSQASEGPIRAWGPWMGSVHAAHQVKHTAHGRAMSHLRHALRSLGPSAAWDCIAIFFHSTNLG